MLERFRRGINIRILRKPDIRKLVVDNNINKHDANPILVSWPSDKKKPYVGLTRDTNSKPHWTKYERFLINNNFEYEYFDYHKSNWLEKAKSFDLVIWSPITGPAEMEEIKRKIFIIENKTETTCFPDFETLAMYDDKVMEVYYLKMNDLPVAKTFISNDYEETISAIDKMKFPVVSKLSFGAGSRGVHLIRTKEAAKRFVRKAFSFYGKKTQSAYCRQKNYVYLQEFVDGEGFDTRVTVIGNMIFGYYRKPKKGDFRASGSGIVIKRDLPIEAIKIALETYYKIGKAMLAVDMIKDKNGQYKIIEISPYIWVITPIQMMVNGIIGGYKIHPDGTLKYIKGGFWPQELALKTFLEQYFLSTVDKWKKIFIKPVITNGQIRKT